MTFQHIHDVLSNSPYSDKEFTVHLIMATHADQDGVFWVSQKTLAREARCSERTVRRLVRTMQDDGLLEVRRTSLGNSYLLVENDSHRTSDGRSERTSDGRSHRTSDGRSIEKAIENHGKPRRYPSGTSARPTDQAIIVGSLEPDEAPRASTAKRATVIARFTADALAHGHRKFNHGHFNKLLTQLHRDDGYSYDEINLLLDVFFAHHGQEIRRRNREIDIVRILHQALNSGLENRAADNIDAHRDGRDLNAENRARLARNKKELGL